MSFLDNLKGGALKLLGESAFAKQMIPLVQEALQKMEGTSVEVFGNVEIFRTKLSDPSYQHLPQGLRNWVTAEHWHVFLHSVKDSVFLVEEKHLKLHPDFKASIQQFVHQLIHGQKSQTAAPAEPAAIPPASET